MPATALKNAANQVIELFKTPFFRVIQDGKYFVIEERARENGVVIVAQRNDGRFLLARLMRPAIGHFSYEFPRGAIDAGEEAIEAARRELTEETGLFCRGVNLVGRVHSNTSLIRSHVTIAHASVDDLMSTERDGEVESMQWVTSHELDHMIMSGKITDSHTLSALMIVRTLEEKG